MGNDKFYETDALLKLVRTSPQILEEMIVEGNFPQNITLTEYLQELLDEKELLITDVVRMSLLSKSYVYQVFSGERIPSRDVLLRLGLAISCSIDEMQHLLTLGQTGILYPKVRRDAAILCCMSHGLTLLETDEFLEHIEERNLL